MVERHQRPMRTAPLAENVLKALASELEIAGWQGKKSRLRANLNKAFISVTSARSL